MISQIRKLLNSLQYHIDKNINDTLYQNKEFLHTKWSFFEYNILRWSQRHNYYILLTVVWVSLLVVNLICWKDELTPLVVKFFPNWKKLNDWQGGFLSGQLTIVGVVYPLVIGLIGVLFQNKTAKKTLFPIYQMYSGFMFAGLSGLFLSIFIIAGYFFSAIMDASTYLAICVTTALWLTFNVLLTSWFFASTFLMLDESKRDRLVVRFTIHELCETDIRNRMRNLLLQSSVHNRVLANPEEDILKVSTYKFSDDKFKEITRYSEEEIYAYDVYFSIINIVIRYYIIKFKILLSINSKVWGKWLVSKKIFNSLYVDPDVEREFVVQPMWTRENKPRLIVVRYSGFEIGWISKLLLKTSIITKKTSREHDSSLTSMMLGFVGSANDAIREKNVGEFKNAIENIVTWHVEIASALSFLNHNGEEDNWLLLPTASFFSRSYLDEILTEYYRLAKASVELIPENIEFYYEIIYLHKRIFSKRERLIEREGFSLIQGNYFTWSLLMEWRSYSSMSSDLRIVNKYEDVLFDFVGSWESWLDYIEPRTTSLNDMHKSFPLFINHLEFTAQTVISALRFNNIEAAGWGVDMLNNWYEKLSIRDNGHGLEEYRWHSELVTHDMLLKDSGEEIWITALNDSEFLLQPAFYIAMNNASFDLRVITACYVLLKPDLNGNEQIKQYIKALLSCTPIHPTGAIGGRVKSVSNASNIIGAYIRHRDYSNYGEGVYGAWLSKVLDSFGRVNEQRRVSGRVYSGWGRNDPHSMNRAYVEIAVSLSNNQWQLEQRLYDIIFSEAFRHRDQESLVRDLQDWIRLSEDIEEPVLTTEENLRTNVSNFKNSIQQVIDRISQQQNALVAQAEVDEELLTRFGLTCSQAIFGDATDSEFPINLFSSASFNGNTDERNIFKINIQKYLKKKVAKNIETNRAINEEDWLKQSIKDDVRVNILRKVLRYKNTDEKVYSSAENNILDLAELAKDINNPVLFSGNMNLNRFLRETQYRHELADKFDISFIDGFGKNYICHVGNVIVFSLRFSDVNFSLLTTKDIFELIEFGKVADRQFVEVKYEAGEDDNNVGVLSLSYWMNIILVEGLPCIKTEVKNKSEE